MAVRQLADQVLGQWGTWSSLRTPAVASDSLPAYFDPDDFVATSVKQALPNTAYMLRAYGKAAAAKTATVNIVGWSRGRENSQAVGPGTILWRGQLTTGLLNLGGGTANREPLTGWGLGTTWFEVDSWDSVPGFNFSRADLLQGGNQAILLLPTLGLDYIQAYITDIAGAGQMTALGIMSHAISLEGVI